MHDRERIGVPGGQLGIAMLVVILMLLVLSVIGIGALTLTGLETRMSGFVRAGEAASVAAESCLGVSVSVIQASIANGTVPAALLGSANPAGPVPAGNDTAALNNEIIGALGFENYGDTVSSAPNVIVPNPASTLNNFVVKGDIDRLYAKSKAGSGMSQFGGYEGTGAGAVGGGVEILYRINCVSTNAATNAGSRITAVYSCLTTGSSCQRKI